jgi:cathepsin L
MRILFFILILLVVKCSLASSSFSFEHLNPSEHLDDQWEAFKHAHNKLYNSHHENHELKRRLIWESNMRKIRLHNVDYGHGKHTHQLKMNEFGDLTHEEFVQRNGFIPSNVSHTDSEVMLSRSKRYLANPPSSVDWRLKGIG